MVPASAMSATKPRIVLLAHCTFFPPFLFMKSCSLASCSADDSTDSYVGKARRLHT